MSTHTAQNIAPALNPGDKLGYFQVQSPLAAGGMSLVWKGYDSMLNRDVAIKQLAAAGSVDEIARDKFRREVEVQKKVSANHKNLVQVIDYIEDSRGLFLVMEYVDGSSLDRALAKLNGPLEPKEALGILHQGTVGLAAIHQAGVLHRDLKPANILLPRDGGVKICDFGLATLQTEQDALTHGTARYMAPELYSGENVDARADLYSLGFIAYEMLVGRPAFEEAFKTVLRDQRNQALRWMKWHTNQRLTAPAITKLNPKVPEPLAAIVTRLIDKDPTQRVESAAQLLDVLKRTFSGQRPAPAAAAAAADTPPPAGQFPGSGEKTAPLPQKSRLPWILAGVLGVQVLIGAAYLIWHNYRVDQTVADARGGALATLNEANRLYAEGQYKDAGKTFKSLVDADAWADDPEIGPRAAAGMYFSAAQVRKNEGRARTSEQKFTEARQAYEAALAALDAAAEANPNLNRDMHRELSEQIRAYMAFPNVAAEIEALIEKKTPEAFAEAKLKLRTLRASNPLDEEVAIIDALQQRADHQAIKAQIAERLAEADRLEAQGKHDEALALIEQALGNEKYETDPELQARYRDLADEMKFRRNLALAARAESGNNLDEAIKLYQQINRQRPSKEYQDKITQLTQKSHYNRGRQYEKQDRPKDAIREYEAALPYPPAKRALEDLGRKIGIEEIMQAARAAKAARDWQKMLDLLAEVKNPSPEAETLRREANLRLLVAAGAAAIGRDDLDTAQAKLADAAKIDPNDAELRRLQAELQLKRDYDRLIADGDAARARSEHGKALELYRKALNLIVGTSIPLDPVKQRLQETEYESFVFKARSAMDARQWQQARAYLKAAQRMKDSQIVRDMLVEVNLNDPDGAD